VLQRSWYQMPGCSVQWKMNKNTHGYMYYVIFRWATGGIKFWESAISSITY
jgi:hypothetical protein